MNSPEGRWWAAIEWPTLVICVLCYAGFAVATTCADTLGFLGAAVILTLSLTLYSSFSHEVLHGHPFKNRTLNELLVFPALGVLIPYGRFRDTHLAHHNDPCLTDPYDDPESNFVDPEHWAGWCGVRRAIYRFNNTLFGRILIGPIIGLWAFYSDDAKAMLKGDASIKASYALHFAGLVPVFVWLATLSNIPVWLYFLCVYASHAILKIRTFLEHRMHEVARCRSVIVENGGVLGFLFLNNNLHAVHHARPTLPWYRLPAFYSAHQEHFLRRNGGYRYASYGQIFKQFFLRAKDPVPHQFPTEIDEKTGRMARQQEAI